MQVISLLLAAGADISMRNDFGHTPRDMTHSAAPRDWMERIATGSLEVQQQLQQQFKMEHRHSTRSRMDAVEGSSQE
jgi:hypothetical protein